MVLSAAAGIEFPVNAFTTGAQAAPTVATNGQGDFVVAWQSRGQDFVDNSYGIYAKRFNAAGQEVAPPGGGDGPPLGQGNEFRVNATIPGNQSAPAVAMDAAGEFVVAWVGPADDVGGTSVFAQRYDLLGRPQGEFRVPTATSDGIASQPAVTMDAQGDFVIVWSGVGAGDTSGIFARRFDLLGRSLGPEFRVNVETTGLQSTPSVAMDGRGDFVVAWSDFNITLNNSRNIFARQFSAAGQPLGNEFQVNSFAGTAEAPSVGMGVGGDFVIAWESLGQDASNSWGIYAKRYNAAGQEQAPPSGMTLGAGNEFRVNATAADQQRTPTVAKDAAGDFVVSWATKGQDGSTAASYGVYARQYTAAGSPITNEFQVNTAAAGDQKAPAVAMDEDGDFVAAWQGADANSTGVFAKRYDENTDTAAPVAGQVAPVSVTIPPGASVTRLVSFAEVQFSENLDTTGSTTGANSVTNRANWGLTRNGQDISSQIIGVQFGFDPVRGYKGSVSFSPFLTLDGNYVLTARPAIRDAAGNALDGNFDGQPGGSFNFPFSVRIPVRTGPEFGANVTTAGSQWLPVVAGDAAGDFVVAWQSRGQDFADDSYGVYARRFNPAGVPQQVPGAAPGVTEFLVNITTAGYQAEPSVAMDAAGNFIVVWRGVGTGDNDGVFARAYNAAGAPLSVEFPVNTTTAGAQDAPAVAMDSNGDFVVAWQSAPQDNSDNSYGVYARVFNAIGAPQTGELPINATTAGFQGFPSVGMDAAGEFVVAWQSADNPDGSPGIFARRFSPAGTPLSGEFLVNLATTAGFQTNASVAMDPGGDSVIAWAGNGNGDDSGVFIRTYNAAGRSFGERRVNVTTAGLQRFESVAANADGDFVVAWDGPGPGDSSGVYATRFDRQGTPLTPEIPINTTTAINQALAGVAMDATGDFVVTWASQAQDNADGSYGVYAQRFGANEPPTTTGLPPVSLVENASPAAADLTAAFADPNQSSTSLTYTVAGDTNPSLFSSTTIDPVTGILVMVPAANAIGSATLTVKATDGGDLSAQTSFAVTVLPAWLSIPSGAAWSVSGPRSAYTLTLNSGGFTIIADPAALNPGVVLNLAAPASLAINASAHLAALNLAGAASAVFHTIPTAGPVPPQSRLLTLGSLSIDTTSSLDLMNNDLILNSGGLAAAEALAFKGFNNGDWKGKGLTSSTAASDPTSTTALGTALAGDLGIGNFDGETVTPGAVLVKYTYYGDADLSGFVNGDDESLALSGLREGATPHWEFGDFDYSGHVNGDDYSLFLAGLRKQPVL